MVHHSDDIPFWFDAQEALTAAGALPEDFSLAATMSAALVAYVVHGDPGATPPGGMGPSRPWPPFSLARHASLTIDIVSNVTLDAQAAQCPFWDARPYYRQESSYLRLSLRAS